MATPSSSTLGIVEKVSIASMETFMLTDQIKIYRREKQERSKSSSAEPRSSSPHEKGVHRKPKKKGNRMSKFMVTIAIGLAMHSGLGVAEAG